MIVLDASALLAFLFREAGHEQVIPYLEECSLSTVNLSEVIGRFVRDGHDALVWETAVFNLSANYQNPMHI